MSALPGIGFFVCHPNAGAGAQRGQAGKMKAEGVKAGVPDTFLAVAHSGASLTRNQKARFRVQVRP
jgi:hypothetical protein